MPDDEKEKEKEKEKDPFHPYVQELQKQEKDIEKKIEIIEKILEELGLPPSPLAEELEAAFEKHRQRLRGVQEEIAARKIEDLDQELTDLQALARNPKRFNPQPPPPWVWPWPWPPPPGFPGPGSPMPGVISVGIVTPPPGSEARYEVGLTSRDFIVARSKSTVWVWDPVKLAWAAELNTGGEIVKLEKVDGTIAVYTATQLWLFHPLQYVWLGPLNAEIEEVQAFNLAYPTVVPKKA